MSAYVMMPGSPVMKRVKVPVVLAPSAVTVTVCVVLACDSVGVPKIVPVFQSMVNPAGSAGEMVNTGSGVNPLPVPCMVV